MSIVFRCERNSLENLNRWSSPTGQNCICKSLSVDLSIMYCDETSLKERNDKLHNLYETGFYTDVVLKVNDDVIAVHGIVLSSASEYFEVMLQSGFRESSTKTIDFSSSFEDVAVLKLVIDYMYTGKVMLRRKTLEQVLGAAHLFMLHSLKHHCAQFLLEQLQPQNILWAWKLSYLYEMEELEIICSSLLSVIFCREIIDETDLGDFTSNCITTVLNNKELIKTARHEDVSYLIVSWMSAGDFDTRKDIAKSLLLKYLNNQALEVILDSVHSLTNAYNVPTSQLSLYLPDFKGKISWRRSVEPIEQVTSPVDKSDLQPLFYGILVQENFSHGINIYCAETKKWTFDLLNHNGTPLGIIDSNYLVSLGKDIYNINLINLSTKVAEVMPSVLRTVMRQGRAVNPSKEATHYFCQSGRLHVIMNCWDRPNRGLVFSLYIYDIIKSWSLVLDIVQNLSGSSFKKTVVLKEDFSVKLHAIPVENNIVFVVAQITQNFVHTNPVTDSSEYRGECPASLSASYLYQIDTCKGEYTLLSNMFANLSDIQLNQVIYFNRKLQFLDDLGGINEWNSVDDANYKSHFAKSICYDLESKKWTDDGITIPKPQIRCLPLQNLNNYPRSSVKVCGSILYASVHLSPHIFHVYLFDVNVFEWSKLPNILSPSVSNMTVYPVCTRRPLSQLFKGEHSPKQLETSGFLFMNSILENWKGIKAS